MKQKHKETNKKNKQTNQNKQRKQNVMLKKYAISKVVVYNFVNKRFVLKIFHFEIIYICMLGCPKSSFVL